MSRSLSISGLDLNDDRYEVEQSLVRNKYEATNSRDETVLRGKQKLFKAKEQFPFTDAQGNEVFTVQASGIVDVAGNYALTDAQTEEDLLVLDNDFSILQDTWRIRDARDDSLIAQIDSRGAAVTLARNYVPLGALIPHKYEITGPQGAHVGNIDGQFTMKDRYEITIDDASAVPTEPVIAAAMVIDAIQGN